MSYCPGSSKYEESDAQKTCIGTCLLPYMTNCFIDVEVDTFRTLNPEP